MSTLILRLQFIDPYFASPFFRSTRIMRDIWASENAKEIMIEPVPGNEKQIVF